LSTPATPAIAAAPRTFLEALQTRVIVFDGAMGTRLYDKGVFINKSFEEVNLLRPDLVQQVHEEYVRAGVDVLETNTFGANRSKLSPHGLADKLHEINVSGARIARLAAGNKTVFVAGAVGPLGLKIEPWGPTSREEARAMFAEQIKALAEGGVDLIVLETFSDLNEMGEAIRASREAAPHLPVVAQMTIDEDGCSLYGTPPEVFASRLDAWGADVIGVNCSVGPAPMLKAIERITQVTRRPLSAQPNAGLPRVVEGRTLYLASGEYMGSYARKFIQAGAKIVGGCCGTTPEHIKQMVAGARMLKAFHQDAPSGVQSALPASPAAEEVKPIPFAERSKLAAKLAKGEKVLLVELTPPKGTDVQSVIKKARQALEGGADAINIPDGPRASARMSALATAVCIQTSVGIEAVLHYCCRDRNLLGMQADLLGAYALGIRNLIIITGDPPKMGDYPDATAVFDVDSIGLTGVVHRLNHGKDLGNNSLGTPSGFVIGVGANPGAIDMEREHQRFHWKVDAGAEYAVTQPVFDVDALTSFLDRIRKEGKTIPVVAGIWPLISLRNAEFMKHEVPGVVVPDAVVARMARAQEKGKDEAMAEGVRIAREIVEQIQDRVAGVQVSAPLGRISMALEVASAMTARSR
jgi:methionine synthase / methylenetetrahydrofolate reductase(NADPH)